MTTMIPPNHVHTISSPSTGTAVTNLDMPSIDVVTSFSEGSATIIDTSLASNVYSYYTYAYSGANGLGSPFQYAASSTLTVWINGAVPSAGTTPTSHVEQLVTGLSTPTDNVISNVTANTINAYSFVSISSTGTFVTGIPSSTYVTWLQQSGTVYYISPPHTHPIGAPTTSNAITGVSYSSASVVYAISTSSTSVDSSESLTFSSYYTYAWGDSNKGSVFEYNSQYFVGNTDSSQPSMYTVQIPNGVSNSTVSVLTGITPSYEPAVTGISTSTGSFVTSIPSSTGNVNLQQSGTVYYISPPHTHPIGAPTTSNAITGIPTSSSPAISSMSTGTATGGTVTWNTTDFLPSAWANGPDISASEAMSVFQLNGQWIAGNGNNSEPSYSSMLNGYASWSEVSVVANISTATTDVITSYGVYTGTFVTGIPSATGGPVAA